jgi:L-alanine-DL-glutamate epimerase-like enolase superfamily enzyme
MRIVDIRELTIPISRYADPDLPSGGLTTSLTAVITDVVKSGRPIVGYGYGSVGRYAQGGLIRERFAPRLLNASADALRDDQGNLDPFRARSTMMAGEKSGGHGERCVAVGALDMAIWDAAAKIADLPLYRFLTDRLGGEVTDEPRVRVYAGGGYLYPQNDIMQLSDEIRRFVDLGFTHAKIKVGRIGIDEDKKRIEAAAAKLPGNDYLAVDAMNSYAPQASVLAAHALAGYGLWWFEDVCDPLDFGTQSQVAAVYNHPIAAGEALFSLAEAKLMDQYAGMRTDRDVLVFDPVHTYGLPGYIKIVEYLVTRGWARTAFWPHGGHLFSLHVVAALGLGGAEVNPLAFRPFGGITDDGGVSDGAVPLPEVPGIGFETQREAWSIFRSML